MKITRSGSPTTPSVRRTERAGKGTDSSFAAHLSSTSDAGKGMSVGGTRATIGVDALLSAQEMGDALDSQARARKRGNDLLDRLDELRHGLLTGILSRRQIENLARLVRLKREEVTDSALAEVLDQIELRAEIELAKYSTLD